MEYQELSEPVQVERCASVLTAVEQAVIDHKGQLSTINVANIERLLRCVIQQDHKLTSIDQQPTQSRLPCYEAISAIVLEAVPPCR